MGLNVDRVQCLMQEIVWGCIFDFLQGVYVFWYKLERAGLFLETTGLSFGDDGLTKART
jgi:hypothetical protein